MSTSTNDLALGNIAQLLRAAEFLDTKVNLGDVIESEHGYATTLPMPIESRRKLCNKFRKSEQSSRFVHNELEKNRRAHLRDCLERLKDAVPLGSNGATRHTTLGLINKARLLIKSLVESERSLRAEYEAEVRHIGSLRRRLELLSRRTYREGAAHSLSESSTASSSRSSSSTFSELDDVDVIGVDGSAATSDCEDASGWDDLTASGEHGYRTSDMQSLNLHDVANSLQ